MISYQTERLTACSDITVVNGKLQGAQKQGSLNLFLALENMSVSQRRNPYEFTFADISDSEKLICSICFFKKRDRYEVTWETAENHRRQGYMTEALTSWINWMFTNTNETCLWALISPSNVFSIKTATKCGFALSNDTDNGSEWYVYKKSEWQKRCSD